MTTVSRAKSFALTVTLCTQRKADSKAVV